MKEKLKMSVMCGAALLASEQICAQVTITSRDIAREIGEYSRAYANAGNVDVAGKLGTTGGPHVWDFTSGPTNKVLRFDYVSPNDEGHGVDFPKAKVAERVTDSSDGSKFWRYFAHIPGVGREEYGFYDAQSNPDRPSVPYVNPIVDLPDTIRYRDVWRWKTTYTIDVIGFPARFTLTSVATADAFGTVRLPGIGARDTLRVNELVEYEVQADLLGTGDFQTIATKYTRTFLWLCPGIGIVVQISSKQEDRPPSDAFVVATEFVRVFETSRAFIPTESMSGEERRVLETPTAKPTYGVCPDKLPGKDSLVVVTHGRIPKESGQLFPPDPVWVDDMVRAISNNVIVVKGQKNWQVEAYKWKEKAWTGETQFLLDTVLRNGGGEGTELGRRLAAQKWDHIHLIGHSAGSAVIQSALEVIKDPRTGSPGTTVHLTFLDAYVGIFYKGRSGYGVGADWADSYFSRDPETGSPFFGYTENSLKGAYNVDVTWLDKSEGTITVSRSTSGNATGDTCSSKVSSHRWPHEFYLKTITQSVPGAEEFGFPLSKEAGGWDNARSKYLPGNKPPKALGSEPVPCTVSLLSEDVPFLANPLVNFVQDLSLVQSPTGTKGVFGTGLALKTDSPAWVAKSIEVTNAVNSVSFEAGFTSGEGAEGLLSVY
jgi:hypothetical protein